MELSKTYSPTEVEDKWYQCWLDNNFFHSEPNPDKEPYTVMIPPPNVTGVLHMGHMLNNTIQDILVRRARMLGKEACWVPGVDHASIATEAKVVKMLKDKGIDKDDISREEFLKHAWEWKEKYGGIILKQLRKLGASCDWERTSFTLEDSYYKEVIQVFVDLYKKGLIYRGVRMVNWDPQGQTVVSDEEVIHRQQQGQLYHLRYPFAEGDGEVVIATTRPETILADAAIAVHSEDERYKNIIGKKVLIPLIDREIPVIADDYVDREFGTGCLKVTPAHDLNDYEIGMRHKLPVIDILADDGTLNDKATMYMGEDRFVVRKKIAKELKEKGFLVKTEEISNNLGHSERTDAVIEPRLSTQWFVKMSELAQPALDAVEKGDVQLHPAKFINTYRHWMENIHDWCISRQLWWGHRIPVWYLPDGEFVVATTEEEALKLAQEKQPGITLAELEQDPDVLDTWASSWLWPISVFKGIKEPNNPEINYYYPTSDLVTAPEILFLWVARMMMAGYEYRDLPPFKNVYLTGIVRDKQRRKMSKSLGNSPDPLDLIEQYGADGIRTGMLFSSPAGNDLLFDEKLCEQGRNFSNKIWNAFRLVQGWEKTDTEQPAGNATAVAWFEAKFSAALAELDESYSKYRISEALMTVYKLIWNDFCSWYLEMVKPEYGQPLDAATHEATLAVFEKLLKVLHPFMPFLTEELYHALKDRPKADCIMVAEWPKAGEQNQAILNEAELAFELVQQVRNTRNEKQLSPKEQLELQVMTTDFGRYHRFAPVVQKLANLSAFNQVSEKPEQAVQFVQKGDDLFIPVEGLVDTEKERANIEKELKYTRGFLQSVQKKLSNERFVQNAPEQVLARERQKQADAESKLQSLEKALADL